MAQGGPRTSPTSTYSWYNPSTTYQTLTGEHLLKLQIPEPHPRSTRWKSLGLGPGGTLKLCSLKSRTARFENPRYQIRCRVPLRPWKLWPQELLSPQVPSEATVVMSNPTWECELSERHLAMASESLEKYIPLTQDKFATGNVTTEVNRWQ